jgi:hypothetical protein
MEQILLTGNMVAGVKGSCYLWVDIDGHLPVVDDLLVSLSTSFVDEGSELVT